MIGGLVRRNAVDHSHRLIVQDLKRTCAGIVVSTVKAVHSRKRKVVRFLQGKEQKFKFRKERVDQSSIHVKILQNSPTDLGICE